MYGLASGPTERTSTRELFSLPIGMRTIEPRSTAGRDDLIRCFKVRIETAVRVDAGMMDRAKIVADGENAVDELPCVLGDFLFALRIPENVFAALHDTDVGVHAACR